MNACIFYVLCAIKERELPLWEGASPGIKGKRYPLLHRVSNAVLSYRICGRTLVMFDSFILYSFFFSFFSINSLF